MTRKPRAARESLRTALRFLMRLERDGDTLLGREEPVITKTDMMDSMLTACPSFRAVWEAFVSEWSTEQEKPVYLALASFARHLVGLLAAGRDPELVRVFAVVERWHVDGDAYVREAATIGILENLQNDNLHTSTSPKQLEPFLMPESLKWWRKVERFWTDGTPIGE